MGFIRVKKLIGIIASLQLKIYHLNNFVIDGRMLPIMDWKVMQKSFTVPNVIINRRRRIHRKWHLPGIRLQFSGLRLISLVIVVLVLLPLAYLGIRAMGAGAEGLDYLTAKRTIRIMTNSLWLVIAVTVSAAAIGIPFAWLTSRTDLPLRRVWLILGLLAMVIPSYLAAVAYLAAFGPVGIVQSWLEPLFGIKRLPDIHGFFGAWLAITLFTYPYVMLPVRAAFLNTDPGLEEAGQSLGLNRWQVFWRITFPQLRPAMAGGMLLAAMYALSDFGAVAIMRYNAFTRAIYEAQRGFRAERAALLALALVVFTLLLLAIEWRSNSGKANYRIGIGASRKAKTVKLGIWKIPAVIFCFLIVLISVFLPVSVMAYWTFSGIGQASPIDLNMPQLVVNTTSVSALTAFVAAIVAMPLALLAVRNKSRFNNTLVSLAYTGNVLPGIVIALALVYFAARYTTSIYQTVPLLILGYATRFLPFSIGATRSALTQVNPKLEEVAHSLGLSRWQVIWRVTIPLAKTGILGGAALIFLSVMKELPTTLILRPIGFETFSTRIWSFYNEAFLPQIGLPGFMLMGVSALGLILILWHDKQTTS
ncbi:MAG: iron ABC transporter permease [Anaerolineae bacterium]|nr:iron ABC transporter permease [Anaerolineae bacterium]